MSLNMMIFLKISIIIVCCNSANTISDTLEPVASLTYKDYEHIIVDCGSEDGTVDLIKRHEDKLSRWV